MKKLMKIGIRAGLLSLFALFVGTTYAAVPTITSVTPPSNGWYEANTPDSLTFTVNFSENVNVSGGPASLTLDVGGASRSATCQTAVSNVGSITCSYTVTAGDTDYDGIGITASLVLNGASITSVSTADVLSPLTFVAPNLTGVTVDTTGPTGTIANGSGDPTNDDTPTLNLTIADTGVGTAGAQMRFSCDNATWTSYVAYAATYSSFDINSGSNGCATADGPHTVYVQFQDSLQNVSASTYNTGAFTLDTTGPVVTITAPAVNSWTNGTQTFTYTANDATGTVTAEEAQIGGSAFVAVTSGDAFSTVSGWGAAAEGLFTLSVRATDDSGNTTTATRTFQKDTVAPVLTEVTPILGPEGGFYAANAPYTNVTTPSYTFNSSDAGSGSATIAYAGGCTATGTATNGNNTITMNALTEGQYTCTVAVTDAAGNQSLTLGINSTLPAPYTNWFVVDTTSPTIPQVVIRTIHTAPPTDPTGDLTYLTPSLTNPDPGPDPNPGTPDYYAQQGDTVYVCFNEADNFLAAPTAVPLVQVTGDIMGRSGVFTYGPVTGPCFDEGFDWELALTGNGTDPEGLIAWALTMNDQAGNGVTPVATTDSSIATYDRSAPVINDVRIYAVSDDNSAYLGDFPTMYGNDGDAFYLYFEVTDAITEILRDGNGEIIAHLFPGLPEETPLNFEYDAVNTRWQVSNDNQAGYVAVTADGSGNNYMVPNIANWAEGQVTFQIRIIDQAGNELAPPITQNSTTAFDNSSVIYDQTRPLLPNPANVVDLNGRATTRLKVRADAMVSWTGAVDPDTGTSDLTSISGHDSTGTSSHDGQTSGIWKYKMLETNNFDADDPDSITKGVAPYPYVIDYDNTHDHFDEIRAAHGGIYGFSRDAYGPTNANDEPYREIHSGTDSEGRALDCLNVGTPTCSCGALQTHPGENFHIYPQDTNPNATSGTYPATYTRQDAITGFDYLAQVGIGGLGSGVAIDYDNGGYSDANLAFNRQRRGAIVTDVTNTGAGTFDGRYTQLDPWVTYGPGAIPPRENDLFNDRYFPYRFNMVAVDKAGNHSCGYEVIDDPATNPGGPYVRINNAYCSSEDSTLGEGLGLDWRGMPIYEQPYTVGISGQVVNNLGEPVIGAMACAVSRDNRDDGPAPANIREFCDAPYETCCDVVDNTGHYGIPVNRDQYYNVTFYKPGFYFQKKDDDLIANQCGIYNDLVLNSILNIFDSVHEWGHIANQPVRIGSSALFMVGDLPVETYIDVWSLTGNIQVEQSGDDPDCATIRSIGRIFRVHTNNPNLTFTNIYGTDDIQSQVYSVTGNIDPEGDHRNTFRVCGLGTVHVTGSIDGSEQFNDPFETVTNGQATAFSSGASRTGVNWIPSTGEGDSFRSGRLRGDLGDIHDLALDANSSEYYHELNNLSQEIPGAIKTCVNRNGYEYFCGYIPGRIGLDDYKYAASKRNPLAADVEDLKSAYAGNGAERRQEAWERWGDTPNMQLEHAKQKFEKREELMNGRPASVAILEEYSLADTIMNNRNRKYQQKQKPDMWERHPDIEREESEIVENDMMESMQRLKDFYERVWEERQIEAAKKQDKYFFFPGME